MRITGLPEAAYKSGDLRSRLITIGIKLPEPPNDIPRQPRTGDHYPIMIVPPERARAC